MNRISRIFVTQQPLQRRFTWSDAVVLLGIAALIYAGVEADRHMTKRRSPAAQLVIRRRSR